MSASQSTASLIAFCSVEFDALGVPFYRVNRGFTKAPTRIAGVPAGGILCKPDTGIGNAFPPSEVALTYSPNFDTTSVTGIFGASVALMNATLEPFADINGTITWNVKVALFKQLMGIVYEPVPVLTDVPFWLKLHSIVLEVFPR